MKYATAIPIGRGGMGEVAKAWDPTLDRWVALKFLRHPDPELEARMVREARAQARVDHPNVCRVYEVGEQDGRPFIAMQYIEGKPLDQAAQALPLEAKVALVKTVAEAVHAAHAVGLVHRDLKPANILVEEAPDGTLEPYVVDFGIAREHAVSDLTVTGEVLGTPGYLSPEQARGATGSLDRRSDVYSLGVVLYELLAGERPHGGHSNAEVLANLLAKEPRPLHKPMPHVPRDLESVVMRCLEAEPDRRYPSARALAEDLGRFLDGEPVLARPTTPLGRLWRRARRNRLAAAASIGAGIALIVLAAALVAGWIKYTFDLQREKTAAVAAQDEAEASARQAREISDFLVGLFEGSDPGETGGEEVTARQILDRGAADLEADLGDQPVTRAAMMQVMGRVYTRLGLYEQAERILREALAIRQRELGEDSPEVADTLKRLGQVKTRQRLYDPAAELFRRALRIRLGRFGPDDLEAATIKVGLARCHREQGDFAQAESLLREALDVETRELGPDAEGVLDALALQASIVQSRGDPKRAAALYTDLLERQRRVLGPDGSRIPVTLNNLAYALRLDGDLTGAAKYYRQALELSSRLHGASHPNALMVLQNLASVTALQGDREETERLLRRKIELERSSLPPDSWRLGSSMVSGLGRALVRWRRYGDAEPVLRQGTAILETALGTDHTWVANARGMLGTCLVGEGKVDEGQALIRRSLKLLGARETFSRQDWWSVQEIADRLDDTGRTDLAERYRALLTDARKPEGL